VNGVRWLSAAEAWAEYDRKVAPYRLARMRDENLKRLTELERRKTDPTEGVEARNQALRDELERRKETP